MPDIKYFKNKEERNAWYRAYRKACAEHFRKYNKEFNKKWRKENGYASEERWKKANPEKVEAQQKANQAKKMGKIILKPCEMCGKKEVVMHHDDYTKPLDVRFLCKIHHRKIHYGNKIKKSWWGKLPFLSLN